MDRERTKFMRDNDKRKTHMLFGKINWGNANKKMKEIGNKNTKQTRYAIPTLSGNWKTQPHDNGILLTQLV